MSFYMNGLEESVSFMFPIAKHSKTLGFERRKQIIDYTLEAFDDCGIIIS